MALEVLALFIITLALALHYYFTIWNSKVGKFIRQIGGPPKLPLFGNALELTVPHEELSRVAIFEWAKYGPRYTCVLGPRVYFTSFSPPDVEKLLSSSIEIQKGGEYFLLHPWLGQGLLTSGGDKWAKRRKLLTPSFHFQILAEFVPTMNEKAMILVDILREDTSGGDKVLEICRYLTLCSLDIICETAMGRPVHAQLNRDAPYVKAIHEVNRNVIKRGVRPWLYSDIIWSLTPTGRKDRKCLKLIHDFTEKVIRERRERIQQLTTSSSVAKTDEQRQDRTEDDDTVFLKKKGASAFLDILLEAQARNPGVLSDLDIREETDTFMFEGHDTISASLAWTVFLLANNPACQSKVIEELDSIFENDKGRAVNTRDLYQLKYLECCMKESLRLYPSVPYISRQLKNDVKLDDGVTVPAGITWTVSATNIHRDPKIFPDPEVFMPERFFLENVNGRHPFAYIPFSAGPRNCIGQKFALMEGKVVLAQLFRNFTVEAVDKPEDIVVTLNLITRSKNGLRVRFHQR